jgi:hypothetical protein
MNNKLLYNVTVKVDGTVADEWLSWMKSCHIPDVMKTGLFERYALTRIIPDEGTGDVTYAVQYISHNMKAFMDYNTHHAPSLQKELLQKYGEKCLAFRTLMEIEAEG